MAGLSDDHSQGNDVTSMKARVSWVEGMMFTGESGSGHAIVMDGAPENGGRNVGIRPMELMLLGLAGCTAFDVVLILKRGREPITDCVVEVEAERAAHGSEGLYGNSSHIPPLRTGLIAGKGGTCYPVVQGKVLLRIHHARTGRGHHAFVDCRSSRDCLNFRKRSP